MSLSSRMDTVAPRRERMINTSKTLMWYFLYGFTTQITTRQSKMSRQWMNYEGGRGGGGGGDMLRGGGKGEAWRGDGS